MKIKPAFDIKSTGEYYLWEVSFGMQAQTPGGVLSIQRHQYKDYTGFTLMLDDKQVGVFEYDPTYNKVRIIAWERPGSENYTAMIEIMDHVEWVDCENCGRTHEDLAVESCRDFKVCPKCGDAYRDDHFAAHELNCDGVKQSAVAQNK